MKKEIGLWIDHHKAVIVTLTLKGEVTQQIESAVDRPTRFLAGLPIDCTEEEIQSKQLEYQLNEYYQRVVLNIRDAESILIFGPGEAKNELEKHLIRAGLEDEIVDIQPDGEMTDRQISAKTRRYFPNNRRTYFNLEEMLAYSSSTDF